MSRHGEKWKNVEGKIYSGLCEEKTAEASFVFSGLEIPPFQFPEELQQGSYPDEAQSLLTARNSSTSNSVAVMMG